MSGYDWHPSMKLFFGWIGMTALDFVLRALKALFEKLSFLEEAPRTANMVVEKSNDIAFTITVLATSMWAAFCHSLQTGNVDRYFG